MVVMALIGWLWGDELSRVLLDIREWVMGTQGGDHGLTWLLNAVLGLLTFVIVGLSTIVLMAVSAVVFVSVFGMSYINRMVAAAYFPHLTIQVGLSTWRTVWHTVRWTLWFAVFWMISVPAYVLAGLGALMQGAVIARYNQKIFTLDALADHANKQEFEQIAQSHRVNLFVLGVVVTLLGAFPTFVWVGSVLGAILLPITALVSVLMFTTLFTFCGVTYSCYCLQALSDLRAQDFARLNESSQTIK